MVCFFVCKSKLLEAFKDFVSENVSDANIVHINFNLAAFDELKSHKALNQQLMLDVANWLLDK